MHKRIRGDRDGFALVLVMVVMVVVASVAAAASMISGTSGTMAMQHDRRGTLIAIADAGLEQARATVNGNKSVYPDSGYAVLENGVTVVDASGATIPGVTRWLYVGPSGITTGQYGVFGTVISVVRDGNGDRIIRRGEVFQESFAKYAYFTDFETMTDGTTIYFASGDEITGPVHSNDDITIHSSGAWFRSTVTTAEDVNNPGYGTFDQGYTEGVRPIPMPGTADLNRLRTFAQVGNSYVSGHTAGDDGEASVRIEFVPVDLNGDGDTTDPDEGFMRIYKASSTSQNSLRWVTAHMRSSGNGGAPATPNCGDESSSGTGHSTSNRFERVTDHPTSGSHNKTDALKSGNRRCYLGGSEQLNDPDGFKATGDGFGTWLARPTTYSITDPRWASVTRPDKNYLWPLSRTLNPNFKGVVFVDGKVAISGVVRGRITLAATDKIIIADDVTYSVPPGGACTDILGLFSGDDVVIANNLINTPFDVDDWDEHFGTGSYPNNLVHRNYDLTGDGYNEQIHAVVLALGSFTAEDYDEGALYGPSKNNSSGPGNAEECGNVQTGRGCLDLQGGIIQRRRGPVGLTNGRGYVKRYTYDKCAASEPPPYFPTTGWFAQGRYFEVDPRGFNVDTLYKQLTPVTP